MPYLPGRPDELPSATADQPIVEECSDGHERIESRRGDPRRRDAQCPPGSIQRDRQAQPPGLRWARCQPPGPAQSIHHANLMRAPGPPTIEAHPPARRPTWGIDPHRELPRGNPASRAHAPVRRVPWPRTLPDPEVSPSRQASVALTCLPQSVEMVAVHPYQRPDGHETSRWVRQPPAPSPVGMTGSRVGDDYLRHPSRNRGCVA